MGILKLKLALLELFTDTTLESEVKAMAKRKKNPSKAGVSAASVKGNAGPTVEMDGGGKVNSQNNQYKK
ncbi:hypothetical protein MGA3_16031 [Bacillus methanolicus MGA3]|nr:hypothetical protein MGA3_16031 [Bacillus methanolicus MGA3]